MQFVSLKNDLVKCIISLFVFSSVYRIYLEQQDPFDLCQIGNRCHVKRFQAGRLAPSSEERGECTLPGHALRIPAASLAWYLAKLRFEDALNWLGGHSHFFFLTY